MSDQDPEFGKFHPKSNDNEPREPFLHHNDPKTSKPKISGLHLPKGSLDRKKLKVFLIELQPIVENILEMSRDDQHLIGGYLSTLKEELHAGDFPGELTRSFEKLSDYYNDLLIHSSPKDQEAALAELKALLNTISQ